MKPDWSPTNIICYSMECSFVSHPIWRFNCRWFSQPFRCPKTHPACISRQKVRSKWLCPYKNRIVTLAQPGNSQILIPLLWSVHVSNVYCPNIVCNLCNGTQHDAICRTGMGFNFINRNAYCMILYAFLFGNMLNHWIWSGLSAPSTSTGSCSSAEMDKTW